MTRYDLYGSKVLPVGEVCAMVAPVLGIEFSLRRSDFLGGDYFLSQGEGIEVLTVASNFEDENGELREPEFPEYRVLLQVDGTERGDWIKSRIETLPSVALLRSIVL